MTIIDQRILIPAAPETVWACVSDIDSNTKWQTECTAVSHLSSRRSGPGVRWRSTSPDRREQVLEITTWYDGLGYEYTVVDGLPFASAKGRIRLQEIPEGTIVQWTFTYEPKGVAGSLRSGLGARRRIETAMVESLKNLWRYINQSGGTQRSHEAKSLIREALDYEARANYKPRHPSALEEHNASQAQPELVLTEPPLEEDDTRPRPALQPDAAAELVAAPEPEAPAPPESAALTPEQELAQRFADPNQPAPPAPAADADAEPALAASESESEAPMAESSAAQETPPPEPAPLATRRPSADTAHVSIWEVFGVQPPSEAQPAPAADAAPPTPAPAPPPALAAELPPPANDTKAEAAPLASIAAAAPASAPPVTGSANLAALLGWRTVKRRAQAKVRHR